MADATFGPARQVLRPDSKVTDLLGVLRRHTNMDAASLSMWDADLLVIQVVDGDGQTFGMAPGVSLRLGRDLHRRVEDGTVPSVVRATADDERTSGSSLLTDLGIGAYVATTLTDCDGAPYGMLCCASREPRPELRDRDLQFLRMTAGYLTESLLDLRHMWERRSQISRMISNLIDVGGPDIVYQPIVQLATGAVDGVEALSRFPPRCCGQIRDTLGWFDDARVVGLGTGLEMAAIRRALFQSVDLPADAKLAINASPSTVCAELLDTLCARPDRGRLVVEITEHENYAGDPDIVRAVEHLRARGIHIAIDDTGTGYSGFEQLLQLRPDVVKLDYVITHGVDRDPARRTIAVALAHIAEEIGAKVVAEGIETTAERDAIVDAGITHGQGYFLGRPSPIAATAGAAQT